MYRVLAVVMATLEPDGGRARRGSFADVQHVLLLMWHLSQDEGGETKHFHLNDIRSSAGATHV